MHCFFQFASMEDNKNLRLTSPNISATTFSLDFFFFSFFSFFSVFFLKYIIHVSLSSTKISERDQLASEKHQQTLRDLTIMPGQRENLMYCSLLCTEFSVVRIVPTILCKLHMATNVMLSQEQIKINFKKFKG